MAKRTATREINHENWDQDDEPEDPGTFQRASEEELKGRVIKTAKRKSLNSQGGETGAFSSFTGFGKAPAPASSKFSFTSNLISKTNGVESSTHSVSPMFKATDAKHENATEKNSNLDEYYSKLKGLNESVAKFIKNHVEANPFINLQPVFKDYEKYISELENLRDNLLANNKESVSVSKSEQEKSTASSSTNFIFNPAARSLNENQIKTSEKPTTTQPQISFGFSSSTSIFSGAKPASSTGFTFAGSGSAKPTTGFTFSGADSTKSTTGFSFGATGTSTAFENKPTESEEVEEDSEPPKPEFTPVVEEGHIYTTRCKVFVKKDGNFTERGVGNLFLKPVPSSEKIQLIVRADTSLGNLLCNFILSSSIPIKRLGKKDVLLVCIPTPDEKPPPVPLLLRVKSPEEADQLTETLEKNKK